MYDNELIGELKELTVLYVEDEPDVKEALSSIIRRRAKNLIIADNGQEGLEKFLLEKPDLVITDIKMPYMDGLEMSEKIREHSKSIPIIITSAFSDATYLLDAINKGINQFVLKPFDSRKLFDAIMKCVKEITVERKLEQINKKLSRNIQILSGYKDAIESGSIVSITDPDGKITYVNDAFCKITGFTQEELLGKTHKLIKCENSEYDDWKEIEEYKKAKKIFKGFMKNQKKAEIIFMLI